MLILFVVLLDMAAIVLVVIFLLQHIKQKFDFCMLHYHEIMKMLYEIVFVKAPKSDPELSDRKLYSIPDNVVHAIKVAHEQMKG